MRLSLSAIILFLAFMQVSADSFAQRITLNETNAPLEKVFQSIKEQTGYVFVYNSQDLKDTRVNIRISNSSVEATMKECLKGLPFTFKIIENNILVKKTEARQPAADLSNQQQQVRGRVTDSNGGGIPGVSVRLKGSETGTATDLDGNYELPIPEGGGILVFTSVGFATQEVNIQGREVVNVALQEETQSLEQVVITGYSAQKKADITGSVTVVDGEELSVTPASNLGQQLQGKAAGVTVGTQGAPGSPTMIRIRGIGTVNNNGPLYIIDGVSTRNQNLNSINPNDIESIQVLKDASSASIYGAQASNGVIIITTKKGKMGSPRVTYDAYYSVSTPAPFYDLLDSRDRVELMWKGKKNAAEIRGTSTVPSHPQFGTGETPTFPKYIIPQADNGSYTAADWTESNRITEFSEGTDWYKESTETAPTQNHQLSISGANENSQYLLGLNYYDQKGTFLYSYYKRYSARVNTEFNVRKWLRLGENLTLNFSNDNRFTDQGEGNPVSWSYRTVPWIPVYDIKGEFAGTKANGSGNGQNPVAILTRGKDNYNTAFRLLGNVFGEADILPELTFRTSFGLDHTRAMYYSMKKLDPEFSETQNRNQFTEGADYNFRYVWSNTLTYEKTFSDIHSIKALIGTEFIRDGFGRSMSASRYGYLFEDDINTWTLANGETRDLTNTSGWNGETNLFGVFARIDYALKNRYLLTGIIRRDGSSRFSKSNRYGYFPSISAGWRISEEDFMKSAAWIDDLKFRVGYGVTGNSEIPRVANWADEYTTNPGSNNYDLDGSQGSAVTGFGLGRFGNSDTKWETTQMLNVGFDASFFRGKLEANVEYYIKKTSDMLVMDNYSSLAGEGSPPYVNLGNIENKGWDIAVGHQNQVGKIGYRLGVNVSTYKNKVLKLNNDVGARFWGGSTRYGNVTMTEKGSPVSQFYGYRILGFYESESDVTSYTGVTGDRAGETVLPIGIGDESALIPREWVGKYIFEDVNGDGMINADDKTVIGSPHPDFTGGFNLGLSYGNFDLDAYFYASVGNEIYNQVKWWLDFQSQEGNRSTTMRDRSWEPGKKDAILPILDEGDIVSNKDANTYFVEDGTYLRLQTLSLGYNLPEALLAKASIASLRIYCQAVNLFTLTNYTGLDPEITNLSLGDGGDLTKGVDFGRWPQSRQFLIGVNLTF